MLHHSACVSLQTPSLVRFRNIRFSFNYSFREPISEVSPMLDISALRAKLYCLIYLLTFQIQCSQSCAISQQKAVCSCSCSLEGYLIPRAAIPSDMVHCESRDPQGHLFLPSSTTIILEVWDKAALKLPSIWPAMPCPYPRWLCSPMRHLCPPPSENAEGQKKPNTSSQSTQ